MGETLNLLFQKREDGTFELEVKESWSGRTVSGSFVHPYTSRKLNALQKRLDSLESGRREQELREIGQRLFSALCGPSAPGTSPRQPSGQSIRAVLRSVIQRTLRRRGTVALTFNFALGCDEFARYPWELLHNSELFLLSSGIFTLTRVIVRPDEPVGCELPVHPPMRILYIGASPIDRKPLNIESSFEALERALSGLIVDGRVSLDRLEPPTYDNLVSYITSHSGGDVFDESENAIPCYAVHFDGHGAYGRLCPAENCGELNDADARTCANKKCGKSLTGVQPQTYLCFCDDQGYNKYIGTQALRGLFVTSDVRLAVFSACETATLSEERTRHQPRRVAYDETLATALVTSQVPAVVAMPFSLEDDLSPTFMFHFYDALAHGRTLEEALSRARQAMLPERERGWYIPVLYRHVREGQEEPVALLASKDAPEHHDHPLAQLGASTTFVGREQELHDIGALLSVAAGGEEQETKGQQEGRSETHHLVLTGPPGIGKSALACEVAQRNRIKFPGGLIGISLRDGKSFGEALIDIAHHLHNSAKALQTPDLERRTNLVLSLLRARAEDRELPCLLVVDGFDEVKDASEVKAWLRFLCSLPAQVVVLLTSRSNPTTMGVLEGALCHWFEYSVGKMADADLLKLFKELAVGTGLDQRIHLNDPDQQTVLDEICTLLDGYPLGAELIFGTTHSIGGRLYTPEAATRPLEEVRDKLRETPLEGIWAVLEVAYQRLTPPARLLLSYLAAFKLPFSSKQIVMLVAPGTLAPSREVVRPEREQAGEDVRSGGQDMLSPAENSLSAELAQNWPAARDELVRTSFMGFDGRVYTIHPQIRHFALMSLSVEERRRVRRVAADYYRSLPHPTPQEWFAAFEHLEEAGEPQDLQKAVRLAVDASWALGGRGYASELQAMLSRAEVHALRVGDKTGEGQVLCCLGAILRLLGKYAEALACLTRSSALHRQQNEYDDAGWALYELAMLCREEGNLQRATHYAEQAQDLFHEASDQKGEAWMQMVLGEVKRGYGQYKDAQEHFGLALASFRDLYSDDGSEGCAWVLRDRGTVYEVLGEYSKALADYEEALRLFNTLGLLSGRAWVLADQSVVYTDLGKLDLAEQACSEAISIFHEQAIRRGEGWALRAMGYLTGEQHNLVDARSYYDKALGIFKELGDRVDQARLMNALGAVSFDEGERPVAKGFYEQAQAVAQEQGARHIEGRALRGLGDVACAMHQFNEAENYYQTAFEIATELGILAERCAVLRRLGELRYKQEQYRQALDFWVQALTLDRRLEHPARQNLQNQVDRLVKERSLQKAYKEFCKKYGLE